MTTFRLGFIVSPLVVFFNLFIVLLLHSYIWGYFL